MTEARRLPPPPDLQALVAEYGRYDLIPPEAWKRWDDRVAAYQAAVRMRTKP